MASKYWEARVTARQAYYDRRADAVMYRLNQAYDRALRQINHDVENIVGNFAQIHGLTKTQAICRPPAGRLTTGHRLTSSRAKA
jgi:hypothetical protein